MISLSLGKCVVRTVVICMAVCVTVTAQTRRFPELRQSETGRAYQKLVQARVFNFGGVGWGLDITEEEKAFKVIFESVDAERLFQRLVREANAEGQLYGLFGLRAKDSFSFAAEAQRIQNEGGPPQRTEEFKIVPKGKVRLVHGCIFYEADMTAAVEGIIKGRWDAAFSGKQPSSIPPKN